MKPLLLLVSCAVWLVGCSEVDEGSVTFLRRCLQGDGDSCSELGLQYLGASNEGSFTVTSALLIRGCTLGSEVGCNIAYELQPELSPASRVEALGSQSSTHWTNDDGTPMDDAEGFVIDRAACEMGDVLSCVELGAAYTSGRLQWVDGPTAVELFEKSCEGHVPRGCKLAGLLYRDGNSVQQDREKGTLLLQRGCIDGDPTACAELDLDSQSAALMHNGPIFPIPTECPSAQACFEMGRSHQSGVGAAKDEEKALLFYQRACAYGDVALCFAGALALQEAGDEVVRLNGRVQLKLCCDLEHVEACLWLGKYFQIEREGEVGEPKEWFEKACALSSKEACDEVAALEAGPDPVRDALRLQDRCAAGEQDACKSIESQLEKARWQDAGSGFYATDLEFDSEKGQVLGQIANRSRLHSDNIEFTLLIDSANGELLHSEDFALQTLAVGQQVPFTVKVELPAAQVGLRVRFKADSNSRNRPRPRR